MQIILLLYDFIFLPLALVALFFLSFFDKKIRKGLAGRLGNFRHLKEKISNCPDEQKKILFHVSSYGEFLQAKPLMQELKQLDANICILVSVFSPSGYENIKEEFPVDVLCYFPIDGFLVQRKFIKTIAPSAAVIVRHDIWPNFLWRLRREGIPAFLIDATLPEKSVRYWLPVKIFFRMIFNQFSKILVVSEKEREHFNQIMKDSRKVEIIGDTKYDQVFERSKFNDRFKQFSDHIIFRNKKIFVAGSTWQDDENVIIPAFSEFRKGNKDAFLIIAPHEPHKERIDEIQQKCNEFNINCALLSQLKQSEDFAKINCLIVDMIGILANIYFFAKLAFVGGSFSSKVHNVLEPAVYGIPVIFGPKMENSAEAKALLENGGARIVHDQDDVKNALFEYLSNSEKAAKIGALAKNHVMNNVGSSKRIADHLIEILTNREEPRW